VCNHGRFNLYCYFYWGLHLLPAMYRQFA
jgi:hypothetical protein